MSESIEEGKTFMKDEIRLPQGDDTVSSDEEEVLQKQVPNNASSPQSTNHKKLKYYVRRAVLVVLLLMSCTIIYLFNRIYQTGDENIVKVPKDIIEDMFSTKPAIIHSDKQFQFEKKLWIFPRHSHQSTLQKLYYQNNKYFANKSGFEVKEISFASAREHISTQRYARIAKLKGSFKDKVRDGVLSAAQAEDIILKVTLLSGLAENGGVMLSQYYCLTETFDWLRNISNQLQARRGMGGAEANAFGFYDPEKSSPVQKQSLTVQFEVEKYMRIFPGLKSYFLVAKKDSRFVKALVGEIILILLEPSAIRRGNFTYYGFQDGYNLYEDYFTLSVQRVLQRTQVFLDEYFPKNAHRVLAVDYYGLYSINDLAAGRKFYAYFDDANQEVTIEYLTKRTMEDWLQMIGRIFQVTRLTKHEKMNALIQSIMDGKRDPMIKGSFLQRILFPEQQAQYIIDNPEKIFVNQTNEAWSTLPKKIWVYWDEGIENSRLSNQLCARTLRNRGKESGFEVNFVDEKNLHNYLEKSVIDKIQLALDTAKTQIYPQTKPDIYRLALLITHGGIYLDASFLALTNFDWLINIGNYSSKYIDNRYGHLPKVFMQYHPLWGGNLSWSVNTTLNTRVQWELPYENNFIAAEKDNEFLKDWFNFLITAYSYTYPQFQAMMRQMKMNSPWNITYLVPMDALKYVIARKQAEIKANSSSVWSDATQYYGIWSMNGHLSFQKYRVRNEIEAFNQLNNTIVYRYSLPYVQGIHGRNFHLAKFYGPQNVVLSDFILQNRGDNYAAEAHPHSLFMTHMMDKGVEFYYKDGWKVKQ